MYLTPNDRYASFMLRLQWAKNDELPTWVVSMQSTKTGELRWFPNLDALIAFLRDEFGERNGEKAEEAKGRENPAPTKNDHPLPVNR